MESNDPLSSDHEESPQPQSKRPRLNRGNNRQNSIDLTINHDGPSSNGSQRPDNSNNTDEDESDDSEARIGPNDKRFRTEQTGASRSDICHDWIVNGGRRWPKETVAIIQEFMLEHEYFNYKSTEKANVDTFKKLFKQVRGRAHKLGWTTEDDNTLSRKLQRKIDNVRSTLYQKGAIKPSLDNPQVYVTVNRNSHPARESLQRMLEEIAALSDEDALIAARAIMIRVGKPKQLMAVLSDVM